MGEILAALSIIICLVGLFAITFPEWLLKTLEDIKVTTPLRLTASFIRILMGAIIIAVAGSTPFPGTLQIIGILLVAVGGGVLVVGNARIQSLMDWVVGLGPKAIRIGGIGGLLFGGFLLFAVP